MTGRWILWGMVLWAFSCGAPTAVAGEFAGKPAAEWVKMLREHKDAKHRRVAVIALETIGPKVNGVSAGLLEALQDDPEPEIRREIAILLGRMGPDVKGAADALGMRLAQDKSPLVRQAAAAALGGKLAAVADGQVRALAHALKDAHEGTRRAAAETLKALGEAAESAVPQLIEAAKDPAGDRFTRVYAIQVIGQWGQEHKATAPTLVAVLGTRDAPLAVRQAAAEALARFGDDPAGVAALGAALADSPPALRRTAAVALGQLADKSGSAWPAIKATLQDKKSDSTARYALIRAAAGAAREHPDAVPVLAKLAQTDDAPENRLAAIQELGGLGAAAETAAPILQEIAEGDARVTLRTAAETALKKIKGTEM